MSHLYADDLGRPNGNLIFHNSTAARRLLQAWRFQTLGNRPLDHAERDMIFGALRRDPRCHFFFELAKNRPAWLMDGCTVASPQGESLPSARALHFLLLERAVALQDAMSAHVRKPIERFLSCPPTLCYFRKRSGCELLAHPCRMTPFCPFCVGRAAKRIYKGLLPIVSALTGQYTLALLDCQLSDAEFPEDAPAERHRRIQFVRREIGALLERLTKNLGARGGLTTITAGPQLYDQPIWQEDELSFVEQAGFVYRVAVLGIVRASQDVVANRHADEIGTLSEHVRELFGRPIAVEFRPMPLAEPSSLRRMVLGTRSSVVWTNEMQDSGGFRGAFTWFPWFLGNLMQWSSALTSFRHLRTHDRWGNWRENMPAQTSSSSQATADQKKVIRQRRRRRIGIVNRNKRQVRHDRRLPLLAQLHQLMGEAGMSVSESIGHRRIKQLFGARPITERDARWLAKRLKQGATEPASRPGRPFTPDLLGYRARGLSNP